MGEERGGNLKRGEGRVFGPKRAVKTVASGKGGKKTNMTFWSRLRPRMGGEGGEKKKATPKVCHLGGGGGFRGRGGEFSRRGGKTSFLTEEERRSFKKEGRKRLFFLGGKSKKK